MKGKLQAARFDSKDYALRYFLLLPALLFLIEANALEPRGLLRTVASVLNNAAQLSGELTLSVLGVEYASLPGLIVTGEGVNRFVWGCSSYLAYLAFAGLLLATRGMTWRQRGNAFLYGSIAVFLANNARISLFYLTSTAAGFEAALAFHDFVWLGVSGVFVLLLWLYFARESISPGKAWLEFLQEPVTDVEWLAREKLKGKNAKAVALAVGLLGLLLTAGFAWDYLEGVPPVEVQVQGVQRELFEACVSQCSIEDGLRERAYCVQECTANSFKALEKAL